MTDLILPTSWPMKSSDCFTSSVLPDSLSRISSVLLRMTLSGVLIWSLTVTAVWAMAFIFSASSSLVRRSRRSCTRSRPMRTRNSNSFSSHGLIR